MSDHLPEVEGKGQSPKATRRNSPFSQKSVDEYLSMGQEQGRQEVRPCASKIPRHLASWRECMFCSPLQEFLNPSDFVEHVRSSHCTREGGKYICRYSRDLKCRHMESDGVCDSDLVLHVRRYHSQRMRFFSDPPLPVEWLPRPSFKWVCDFCGPSGEFNDSASFIAHVRSRHTSEEEGSYYCRYGADEHCPYTPEDGFTEFHLKFHLQNIHFRHSMKSIDVPLDVQEIPRSLRASYVEEMQKHFGKVIDLKQEKREEDVISDRGMMYSESVEENSESRQREAHSALSSLHVLSSSASGCSQHKHDLTSLSDKLAGELSIFDKETVSCEDSSEALLATALDPRFPIIAPEHKEGEFPNKHEATFPLLTKGLVNTTSEASTIDAVNTHAEPTPRPAVVVQGESSVKSGTKSAPYVLMSPYRDGSEADDERTD